jgi:signal transduction histidine kinase/CheY-like chemotaxis protein
VHPFTPSLSYLSGTLVWLLCLLLPKTAAHAQQLTSAVLLTHVPNDGFLLKEGWRFQARDIPNGASPKLDDRLWSSIDPTKDVRELPQLQGAGIGWLRLHIHTGPDLPPLMIKVFQSVASEMYLDGRLLYRFGTICTNPDSVRAYNPAAAFSLPLRPSTDHVLAIRVACQPGWLYTIKDLSWDEAALQFWVFPTTAIPAIKPVDVQSLYLDTFRLGIAFILFFLHLSLFFAHRAQHANRYATGMYLSLGIPLLARIAGGFTHSLPLRMLVYYCTRVDVLVPGLVVLTFYSLFRFRRGWLFWMAMSSVFLKLIPLSADFQWLSVPLNYFLPLELIRLSLVAVRRNLPGGRIVSICAFTNFGIWTMSYVLLALQIPNYEHEWFFHAFYLASFICFPLTLSLLLASEHGWINRQLIVRLQEVETLSARNLAQQQERQQLLTRQNEYLEEQVTERTYELHQQANQLRELDRVKSRFVANITHEFRTPLSLIISPVDKMMQENRFDRPLLTTVQRNAGQLLRLINQLLDLSKLEFNSMPIALVQGDVTEFVRQFVTQFQPLADQKGVVLTGTMDTLPPQEAVFDADKWEKILTNLLANALKFTASGGQVRLHVSPVLAASELVAVQFELADSGIGIAADVLPHIFDRFYQADTSSTRVYGGTGIGLALVKELVDLLGGTLLVTSEPSVGTTFQLTLPVQPVTEIPLPTWTHPEPDRIALPMLPMLATTIKPDAGSESRPCLLIVEDNNELRALLAGELATDYQIMQAADGEEGWALVQTELPDIVVTDLMMPGMNGYELTRHIKSHSNTDHIAVVMLTARAAQPSRIEGLQRGADEYLTKPFSVAELHLRLHNMVSRQQKLAEHYRQQFALPTAISVELKTAKAAVADPFLLRIYGLLDQHLDDPTIGVDWLADQLAMNRKTLYRKVQSLIQLAPADLIRQYRLRRAAELLKVGHNVAETADRVGFNTPSHFSLVFKETYQQTPTEFVSSQLKRA